MFTPRLFPAAAILSIIGFLAPALRAVPNGLQDVGTTAFTDVGANITSADYVISGSFSLDQDTSASSGKGAYLTSSSTTEQTITVSANNTTVGSFELTAIVFEEYSGVTSASHKVWIVGNVLGGGTVGSVADAVTGSGAADNYSGARTAAFNGVRLTSFVIHIDPVTQNGVENLSLRSFTTANALGPDTTPPTISIGAPSASLTRSGPISYIVTYADANFNAATLSAASITVNSTGTAGAGSVTVTGTGTARTVTLSAITGTGTLGISVAAGTASDMAGNTAPAAGPSTTFAVDNTPPEITSATTASGTYGAAFNYTIAASGAPVSFGASGLPSGLSVNTANGAITGTPTQTGAFSVTLNATDSVGNIGSTILTLTIAKAAATVTLGGLSQTYAGVARVATATTTPAGLAVAFTYDGSAAAPTHAGSYAVVGTISDTNYQGFASAVMSVAPAALVVAAENKTRPYGSANPALTATITGFVNGENAAAALTGSASLSTAADAASLPGPFAITTAQGSLAANNGNYSFSFAAGVLTVRKLLIDDWRAEYFTAPELADPSISGALADPDGDGLTNLQEFAFGTDPRNTASGVAALAYAGALSGGGVLQSRGQPVTLLGSSGGGTTYHAVFIRRSPAFTEGLVCEPEFSADLATWDDALEAPEVLAADDLEQAVGVSYPDYPVGQNTRFFRVSIQLAE